jgi:hypothetical protein
MKGHVSCTKRLTLDGSGPGFLKPTASRVSRPYPPHCKEGLIHRFNFHQFVKGIYNPNRLRVTRTKVEIRLKCVIHRGLEIPLMYKDRVLACLFLCCTLVHITRLGSCRLSIGKEGQLCGG